MKWREATRIVLAVGCAGALIGAVAAVLVAHRLFFTRTFGEGQWYEIEDVEAPAVLCMSGHEYCVGVQLKPQRYYEYPDYEDEKEFRGQFDLFAQLRSGGRMFKRFPLPPRWAGAVRMNLYLGGPDTVVIRECAGGAVTYVANLEQGVFRLVDTPESTGQLRFLGAFDADSKSRWRFIPAAERAELRLPAKPVCDVNAYER